MKILITNDDGIDSPFLSALVRAFSPAHELVVAAPASEQSWIGRAMTRQGRIEMSEMSGFPCPAYSLTGTPSDCVNIALGHLCQHQPDLVLSGINIGHNAGLSFVSSSGTIGAALEGALHDVPSIAASMYLTPDRFKRVGGSGRQLDNDIQIHVDQAAAFLVSFAGSFFDSCQPKYGRVYSINFPSDDLNSAKVVNAAAAHTLSQPLFERDGNTFAFRYQPLDTLSAEDVPTDRDVVHGGDISLSVFDFAALGR